MAAYMVARLRVKDAEALAAYSAQAARIMAGFGGKPFFKGGPDTILSGALDHNVIALFEFPDEGQIRAFHDSPEYQAILPLRDQAADMVLSAHSAP